MKKDYIETGKIVGTHGVRGALRVQPWCDSAEFLSQFKKLFFKDATGFNSVKIKSSKPHGNVVIMEIDGVNDMDSAEVLRGKVLYLQRKDLKLEDDQYLICDIIDCEVYDADSNENLGTISDVSKTGANDVWHIMRNGKEYLIPVIDDVVIKVDVDTNKVVIRPLLGVFED